MSYKPISPLRQRMIDDMTARRVKEKAQKDYIRQVRTFAAFLGRSPGTATSEDLRRFPVHLAKQQIGVATINAAIAAPRFFFNVTLERPDLPRPLTTVNQRRRAPVVLSQEEVARLLEAATGLKYKAARSVAYGAGLRVSEVVALKVSDIDSQRMTLRVEQGNRSHAIRINRTLKASRVSSLARGYLTHLTATSRPWCRWRSGSLAITMNFGPGIAFAAAGSMRRIQASRLLTRVRNAIVNLLRSSSRRTYHWAPSPRAVLRPRPAALRCTSYSLPVSRRTCVKTPRSFHMLLVLVCFRGQRSIRSRKIAKNFRLRDRSHFFHDFLHGLGQ